MSWSDFEITADYIRDKEPQEFPTSIEDTDNGYDDAQLVDLHKDQAKREMLLDLKSATGKTDFDDILSEYAVRLKEALSCKQLYLYFGALDMGDGTMNNSKMKRYRREYENYSKTFASLRDDGSNLTTVKRAIR